MGKHKGLAIIILVLMLTGCQKTYHIAPDGDNGGMDEGGRIEQLDQYDYREELENEECILCA